MDSVNKQFAIYSANSWTRCSSDTAVVSEGNADMCYSICDQVQLRIKWQWNDNKSLWNQFPVVYDHLQAMSWNLSPTTFPTRNTVILLNSENSE